MAEDGMVHKKRLRIIIDQRIWMCSLYVVLEGHQHRRALVCVFYGTAVLMTFRNERHSLEDAQAFARSFVSVNCGRKELWWNGKRPDSSDDGKQLKRIGQRIWVNTQAGC